MKTPRLAAFTLLGISVLGVPARAASDAWTGATDATWATSGNWLGGNVPGAGDTATFNAASANTTIDLGGGVTLSTLLFDTANAAAYTIGSGAVGDQTLTLDNAGGITVNADVTANQLVNVNLQLAAADAAASTLTNNGLGTLTLAGAVNANVTSGNGLLTVTGSGNTTISGVVTNTGAGANALLKTGAGMLTLSNGSVWNGTGATQPAGGGSGGSPFSAPAIVQEGTLLLNGGTHAVTGELVIGGVITPGGAGQNAKIQVDSGALTVSSWLSLGRGNGVGGVSSDLEINGSASVTTLYLSAGYNAASALNLPKGSITLNGSSQLTVTNTVTFASFIVGESAGSNVTMTVNDTAVVNRTGGNTALANQAQGAFQIGRDGTGTVIMNGGTINVASTDLGRGVNASSAQNGTLTIKTGATYNNEGDFRTGFAGSGQGTLNLEGGTLNIGTTTARTLIVGTFDTAQSTLNIQSGNLNLNANSNIRFNQMGGTGAKVINLNGGAITSYSDNAITANGSGVLDLMNAGAAGSNNTFNLNGGTLAIRQVLSTATTGTRTFNFNGGTLKATGTTTTFFNLGTGGTTLANVRNGGAKIDTNGFDVTIGQALVHSAIGGDNAIDGGLIKNGLGKLTLSGTNTFTGNAVVNAGTLSLATNVSLNDSIVLSLASGTTLALDFASDSETIFALVLNGSSVTPGIYTGDQLNTLSTTLGAGVSFTSLDPSVTLTVTSAVPEPGTVALLVLGFGSVMILIRRRKQMA